MLWKQEPDDMRGDRRREPSGALAPSPIAEDQARLARARDCIRAATDELLANYRITEVMRPLPPGRPDGFIDGWSAIGGALANGLNRLVYEVQMGRMTLERALGEAEPLILWALRELRPDARVYPASWRQQRYAQVGAFVRLVRYLEIANDLANQLWSLSAMGVQAQNGAVALPA